MVQQRGPRNALDRRLPYGFFVEDEKAADGELKEVATVLLTNRECPWRCVMCDLWKNTLTESVPSGAIAAQVRYALDRLPKAQTIKLYNSGSFFDAGAIPVEDYAGIAAMLQSFDRVIVECHPALVGDRVLRLRDLLAGRLEVAMGLETAHRDVLAKLNKGMTLETFSRGAAWLMRYGIDLRSFVLLQPPFLPISEGPEWANRSVRFAFGEGASAVSIIPTRGGNGAMERLEQAGAFEAPGVRKLERAIDGGLNLRAGRVFADLWDLKATPRCCPACFEARMDRLRASNLSQQVQAPVVCRLCGDSYDPEV